MTGGIHIGEVGNELGGERIAKPAPQIEALTGPLGCAPRGKRLRDMADHIHPRRIAHAQIGMRVDVNDFQSIAAAGQQIAHDIERAVVILDEPTADRGCSGEETLAFQEIAEPLLAPRDEVRGI